MPETPLTAWGRMRREKTKPQVGDVLVNERGERRVVTRCSGIPQVVNSLDLGLGFQPILFWYQNEQGETWGALSQGDEWVYESRADNGPLSVVEEAPDA